MTKPENTHNRDLIFNDWVRAKLPDSSLGFLATDLDFILYQYKTKKIMLLEIKQWSNVVENWQRNIFNNLNRWLVKGIDNDWNYLGFHCVRFEKRFFDDGLCWFDGMEISEQDLVEKLSFYESALVGSLSPQSDNMMSSKETDEMLKEIDL